MRKFINVYKRTIAIIAIVLMSINTYATTASNDGSNFITKAEFDNLMETFNDNISEYQSSLNAKIDGAIAKYLGKMAGESRIKLENYVARASESDIRLVEFTAWQTPVATKNVEDVNGSFCINKSAGVSENNNSAVTGTYYYGWCGINNNAAWNGSATSIRYTNFTGNTDDYTSSYYFAKFPYKDDNNYNDFIIDADKITRRRLHIDLYAVNTAFFAGGVRSWGGDGAKSSYTADFSQLGQPGGFAHASYGNFAYFTNGYSPYCIQTHTWSVSNESGDKLANYFLNYNIAGEIAGSDSGVDYDKRDYYDKTNQITTNIQKTKAQSGTQGANSGSYVERQTGTTFTSIYNNNITFNFKYNRPKFYDLDWTRLTTKWYNELLNDCVYKYNGIPITKCTDVGKLEFKLILDNESAGQYTYCISDRPFDNELLPEHDYETISGKQYDHILLRGSVSRSGAEVINVSVQKDILYDSKGDVIWLKVEPSVVGEIVHATVLDPVIVK